MRKIIVAALIAAAAPSAFAGVFCDAVYGVAESAAEQRDRGTPITEVIQLVDETPRASASVKRIAKVAVEFAYAHPKLSPAAAAEATRRMCVKTIETRGTV